jgi:hypothetical protein
MQTKQQLLKLADALKDLKGNDESKQILAIKTLEQIGDVSVLPELVSFLNHSNMAVAREMRELLSSLQQQDAAEVLVQIIRNTESLSLKQQIINTMWNSKLDYSSFLADFVSVAMEGDFMLAMECLTLIENMSGPFEEHQLLEAQLHLKEFLVNDIGKDERKDLIVSDIASFIKDQNEGIDADLLLD